MSIKVVVEDATRLSTGVDLRAFPDADCTYLCDAEDVNYYFACGATDRIDI